MQTSFDFFRSSTQPTELRTKATRKVFYNIALFLCSATLETFVIAVTRQHSGRATEKPMFILTGLSGLVLAKCLSIKSILNTSTNDTWFFYNVCGLL
jgi:hypothetical protein